ncbi:MAG: hypothetical protein KDC35_21130 [Acidobacteria bacterium]|nr:hypothetical protein [Acidobacteriota bacterium]
MSEKRSPWVYVGIGCVGLVIIAVIGVAVLGFLGFRMAKDTVEAMKDPVKREENVKAILGATDLPPGYYAGLAVKIPFLMEMAILTDREGEDGPNEDFDQRGFIYFKIIGKVDSELKDYFEGKTDDATVFRRNNINLDLESNVLLERGLIEVNGQNLMYLAQTGRFSTEHGRSEGIQTLILVECPKDKKMRFGIWFGPLPETDENGSYVLAGTPADRDQVQGFMGHFTLCD